VRNQPRRSPERSTAEGGAARRGEDLFFPTLLAWFLPGAGHWKLGMRRKAVCYLLCVWGLFIIGAALGNFAVVSFRYHPYAFLLHLCTGAVSIVMTLITNAVESVHNPTRWGDIGMTMTWIAGALNVLLIADVLDRANGGPFVSEKAKPSLTRRVLRWILGGRK
jgi:hypothetical protein